MNAVFDSLMLMNETPCDAGGYFGSFGGRYVSDELVPLLDELADAFESVRGDPAFLDELRILLKHFSGRPTPIWHCANLSRDLGGAQIWLKREDLNHLGAHKLNNTLGQMLLAKHMGKTHVVAETGAGQHGVAAAATAALLGMKCTVFMGEEDMRRQRPNVFRMRLLGAEVTPAPSGMRTLKEAVDEALNFWIRHRDSFYVLGSAVGPHPYPLMVRAFQSVIGAEARLQCMETLNRLPDVCLACVGGGSNAVGIFAGFRSDKAVRLIGVEPGGRGMKIGDNGASLEIGEPGILHGFYSYMLKNKDGSVASAYSVSAGLDYPGVGPEHSFLKDSGRAEYVSVTDDEAVDAFCRMSRTEGIIPALESAHSVAQAVKMAPDMDPDCILLVCLSGRGDKDAEQAAELLHMKI